MYVVLSGTGLVSEEVEYNLLTLSNRPPESHLLDVHLNNIPVKMQLDTGAAVSVINATTYIRIQQINFISPLQPAESNPMTYIGHYIELVITQVIARYGETEILLSIHVVNGGGPNLLGSDVLLTLKSTSEESM